MIFWTEEREAELRKLWGEGHSASEIRRIMRAESRSAVLGKIHRLQLPKRPTVIKSANKRVYSKTDKSAISRKCGRPVRTKPEIRFGTHPGGPSEPKEPTIIPEAIVEMRDVFPRLDGLPRTLVDRCHHQCGFPVGDPRNPDFHYCTNEALEIAPNVRATYCRDHMKVAYQPAQVRQRENKRASTIARAAR